MAADFETFMPDGESTADEVERRGLRLLERIEKDGAKPAPESTGSSAPESEPTPTTAPTEQPDPGTPSPSQRWPPFCLHAR